MAISLFVLRASNDSESRAKSPVHKPRAKKMKGNYPQGVQLAPNQVTFPVLSVGDPENIYLDRFQNCYGSVAL